MPLATVGLDLGRTDLPGVREAGQGQTVMSSSFCRARARPTGPVNRLRATEDEKELVLLVGLGSFSAVVGMFAEVRRGPLGAMGGVLLAGRIDGGRGLLSNGRAWRYPSYALVYVSAGTRRYRDSGHDLPVGPGALITVMRHESHGYGVTDTSTSDEVYLVFDGPVFALAGKAACPDRNRPVQTLIPCRTGSTASSASAPGRRRAARPNVMLRRARCCDCWSMSRWPATRAVGWGTRQLVCPLLSTA